MSGSREQEWVAPVRIPADVDKSDRVLWNLTARQVAILATAGLVLWLGWVATRSLVPLAAYAIVAAPVGAGAVVLAVGRRDGLSLDRFAVAGLRFARAPRRVVPTTRAVTGPPRWIAAHEPGRRGPRHVTVPGPLRLPVTGIGPDGTVDLGPDGSCVLALASTVNFALRLPSEQDALIAAFARYLNSLSGPMQIIVRAARLDLDPLITRLEDAMPDLPHRSLEDGARDYAAFLASLAHERELLRRQVILAFPTSPADPGGAIRRAREAVRALAPAGIAMVILDGAQAAAVLADAMDPYGDAPPLSQASGYAAPDAVITATPLHDNSDPHNNDAREVGDEQAW